MEKPLPGKAVTSGTRGSAMTISEVCDMHVTCRRQQHGTVDRQSYEECLSSGGISGTAGPLPPHSLGEPLSMMPSHAAIEHGRHGGR